jgi:hypothetical protein
MANKCSNKLATTSLLTAKVFTTWQELNAMRKNFINQCARKTKNSKSSTKASTTETGTGGTKATAIPQQDLNNNQVTLVPTAWTP